jgi:enoyl-CoA hydratase/carnithine racemase
VDGAVATVTVGDGHKRNALTSAGWVDLERLVRSFGAADGVRAVLIVGREGTFCSGSDIGEWVDASSSFIEESFARMESAFRAIEECPVPVVAAVEGVAAGAGCQLALACDLRFMASSASIGMPIARLGILATPSFAARLVALAGPAVARELLYTGALLSSSDAVAVGLANRVFPDAELRDRVGGVLAAVVGQPAAAVRAAKSSVAAVLGPVRAAADHVDGPAVSSEFSAAVRAFLH